MSEQNTPTEATPKKSKTMLMALVGVVVLGAMGFGGWRYLSQKAAAAGPAKETEKATKNKGSKVKSTMHLDSFVVNLSGSEGASGYLRVGIDLGLNAEEEAAGGEEAKKKGAGPTPILRDTVLTVLGKSKADELLTPEGKEALKKELLAALGERVPELGIIDVFFTEFIVQK